MKNFLKRFKQGFFLVLCAGYFLLRGRAAKKTAWPKAVLIAQLAKIGDMVCTTPMFRAVKSRFPNCKVYVLGDGVNEKLLEGNSDVDGYLVYRRNFFETLRTLRKIKFDFACLTGPGPEIFTLLYLSGIPAIAATIVTDGFSPQQSRIYKLLSRFAIAIPHRMGHYAPREYLRLLEPIGIYNDDTKKYLAYSNVADARVKEFLNSHDVRRDRDFIVGILPGTGEIKAKLWSGEKFAKVAEHLYKKYHAKILILGSRSDKDEIEEMLSFLDPHTRAINTCSMFNIDKLKALISYLSLFISVDTGPIYIAEAFQIPTIDIVGPMDDREQPPIGERHVVVVPSSRQKPEIFVMNTRFYDAIEAKRQSDAISSEMVISAADALIKKLKLFINA